VELAGNPREEVRQMERLRRYRKDEDGRAVCDLCGSQIYLDSYEFIKTAYSRVMLVPADDYGKDHVSYDYGDGSDSGEELFPSDGADIDYLNQEQEAEVGPYCGECDEPMTGECDSCGHTYCKGCYSDSLCEYCGELLNNELQENDYKDYLSRDIR
jgi:hypothetical protein